MLFTHNVEKIKGVNNKNANVDVTCKRTLTFKEKPHRNVCCKIIQYDVFNYNFVG